jgi:hypothetical protein
VPRKSTAECGTPGGYYRHWRAREQACPACLRAHARQGQWRDRALSELGQRYAAERRLLYRRKLAEQTRVYPSVQAARSAAHRAANVAVARRHHEEFLELCAALEADSRTATGAG